MLAACYTCQRRGGWSSNGSRVLFISHDAHRAGYGIKSTLDARYTLVLTLTLYIVAVYTRHMFPSVETAKRLGIIRLSSYTSFITRRPAAVPHNITRIHPSMHAYSHLTSPPPPPRTALHIIRMRQQKLAARKRILARLSPRLVLADAQLDALVVDLVLADLIRQTHATATRDGRPYAAQPARRMHALRLDELAQLPQTLEEGNHGRVDLAVREAEGDGEVA
jgi:hypothetical protein